MANDKIKFSTGTVVDEDGYLYQAGTKITAEAAELNILDGVTATAAEINTAADVSARLVTQVAGAFALDPTTHGNKITIVADADAVITLPAATGSGVKYTILVNLAMTGPALISVTGDDTFLGGVQGFDADADAAYAWAATGLNEVNLNGVATGGKVGDIISFTDVLADKWLVEGQISQSGGSEATPFDTAA